MSEAWKAASKISKLFGAVKKFCKKQETKDVVCVEYGHFSEKEPIFDGKVKVSSWDNDSRVAIKNLLRDCQNARGY